MGKTIYDIALEIGSGLTPLRINDQYWNSRDFPWVKTEQLGAYQILEANEYVSETAINETSIKVWPAKTVSVAMYGEGKTRGNSSILMIPSTTNQACCNIVVDPQKADYRFLYYWLKNNYEQLRSLAAGVRKNLNVDDIKGFPFPNFEVGYQSRIADALSAVDDLIENNSKLCESLESMAKTLYDYWFTQFDFPNVKGKPYRTSGGAMEWNEHLKREIPKGWTAGVLSDIANITMGQSPDGSSYNEEHRGIAFFQGSTDFGCRFPNPRVYTTVPSRFAKKGDILISVRAPVGTLNIALEACCIGRGLAALNSRIGSQLHLLYTLSSFSKTFDVLNGAGTTFGSITKETLFEMKVVIPPNSIIAKFDEAVSPIEQCIRNNEQENRELTKLRDWLLPMLMNGQAVVE